MESNNLQTEIKLIKHSQRDLDKNDKILQMLNYTLFFTESHHSWNIIET